MGEGGRSKGWGKERGRRREGEGRGGGVREGEGERGRGEVGGRKEGGRRGEGRKGGGREGRGRGRKGRGREGRGREEGRVEYLDYVFGRRLQFKTEFAVVFVWNITNLDILQRYNSLGLFILKERILHATIGT